jgi:hypothetical protein
MRGAEPGFLFRMEEELALAVFGTIFNPEEIDQRVRVLQREAHERRAAILRDADLLAKVDAFSEDQREEYTQQQRRAADFSRQMAARRGISKPWQKDG